MRRALALAVAWTTALVALLPLWLLIKQAFTPEAESLAWPPTWLPQHGTLENFRQAMAAVELSAGFARSAIVAAATVAMSLALAAPAAWLAARHRPAEQPLDGALTLARLFPSLALAIPLAVLFVRLGIYNSPLGTGLWLGHTLLGLPIAFLVLRGGLRAVPAELEDAARLDGATHAGAVWRVTLPLARPALAAAAVLVFLVSWDEFALAILLQVTSRTLPPLLYYLAAFGHPGLACAVAVVMLVPALAILLVLEPALQSGGLTGSGR